MKDKEEIMELGEKLKQSRNNKGFSQTNVAEHLNISRQSISKWENGNSYPDLDNLVRLSEYYEVSIDELLKENQELKMRIEANELEIEKKYQNLNFIHSVSGKDEGLLLLVLAFMGSLIPPIGLIMAPVIIKRNKKTNTLYKLVYFACVCCILINIYALYFTVGNYLGWGTTTVEIVD